MQGNAPAALFPRFLSRKRNRAAGGNPHREERNARRRGGLREWIIPVTTAYLFVVFPHQALRASFPQGKPGYWPPLHPVSSSVALRPPSPPSGLSSPKGSRGSNRPCAGAAKGTLKSKRLLPSRFKVGKLTFSTRLFPAAPLPPSLQRPPHRGAGEHPCRAFSPVSPAQEKPGRRRHPPGRGPAA